MALEGTRFDLSGRVSLVAGGSRGLGRAIVRGLALAGSDVIIVSRKLDACERLAEDVTAETGVQAIPLACHIGHWDEVDALVEAVYERVPKLDVLVNNAAISPVYPSVDAITETMWDKVFAVNAKGPFRLCATFGTRMVVHGSGSIINISSGAGMRPRQNVIPYAASKAALNNLTLSLSQALAPKVRVNCVVSGRFRTDMSQHWDTAETEREIQSYGLQRIAEPDEIMESIVYLASDASSYTTGALLPVDAGYLASP